MIDSFILNLNFQFSSGVKMSVASILKFWR